MPTPKLNPLDLGGLATAINPCAMILDETAGAIEIIIS